MMPAEEYKVHLIALVCFFFCFFFKQQNCCTRVKESSNWARRRGQGVEGYVYPRLPSGPAAAWKMARGEDARAAAVSPLRWAPSKADAVVPEWIETVGSVSVAAVPVGVGEPVRVHQPRVQDLGVSTGHCETGGDTEDVSWMMEKNKSSTIAKKRKKKCQRTPSSDKSTSPLWCHNSHQNLCSVSRSIVFV